MTKRDRILEAIADLRLDTAQIEVVFGSVDEFVELVSRNVSTGRPINVAVVALLLDTAYDGVLTGVRSGGDGGRPNVDQTPILQRAEELRQLHPRWSVSQIAECVAPEVHKSPGTVKNLLYKSDFK